MRRVLLLHSTLKILRSRARVEVKTSSAPEGEVRELRKKTMANPVKKSRKRRNLKSDNDFNCGLPLTIIDSPADKFFSCE